jgi:hypothetical protein
MFLQGQTAKARRTQPWWPAATVGRISGDSGHGRARGAGEMKEEREGVPFYILPAAGMHRGGRNLTGKWRPRFCKIGGWRWVSRVGEGAGAEGAARQQEARGRRSERAGPKPGKPAGPAHGGSGAAQNCGVLVAARAREGAAMGQGEAWMPNMESRGDDGGGARRDGEAGDFS